MRIHGRSANPIVVVVFAVLALLGNSADAEDVPSPSDTTNEMMTNQWHVLLHRPVKRSEAEQLARHSQFRLLRPHLHSRAEWVFEHDAVPKLSGEAAATHTNRLQTHPLVKRAVQVVGFSRAKRGGQQSMRKKGIPGRARPQANQAKPLPTDPLFSKEWFIQNRGQADGTPGLDLNVLPAWQAGYTGRGVTTAIMDDGLDYLHPDLRNRYNAESSFDFSSNDPYPFPRYTDDWFNSHGTRCAGEIAAEQNNGVCGVGLAPGSKVAGLRMLDQPYMTDLIEAAAMSHDPQNIHIYSASWGPTDDGKTVDGPRNETMRALLDGVNTGRGGRGSIYVWASGDGGPNDDCNCDGYAASMWTISINSATNDGQTAGYDESCSSTLASTFSNGKAWYKEDAGVGTTDLYGGCTLHHSGTSAAAPEAAGVIALGLEANPQLTWRDVQHVIVLSSKRSVLHDNTKQHNWTRNGAGLEFNHLFGFGIMDAGDLVQLAAKWRPLPERFHCVAGRVSRVGHFNVSQALVWTIETDGCANQPDKRVVYLEHVQAYVTMRASRRGHVNIFLTSPSGTTSMILSTRPKDADSTKGFTKWPFMSTQQWGEKAAGRWTLTMVFDTDNPLVQGLISEWVLVLHGTQKKPYENQAVELDKIVPKLGMVKRRHNSDNFLK